MVTINNDGFVFGGSEGIGIYNKQVFKISCANEECQWSTTDKVLDNGRTDTVAIPISFNQCITSCPDQQLINVEGKQCVSQCNTDENQVINLEGDQCVSECSNGEVINLVGDQCVTSCPVGSSPDSSNPSQCKCPSGELISVMGDQCLVDCGEDQLGNPTFNVDGEQCETSKYFLINSFLIIQVFLIISNINEKDASVAMCARFVV